MTLRRALAISLVVSFAPALEPLAGAQEQVPDGGFAGVFDGGFAGGSDGGSGGSPATDAGLPEAAPLASPLSAAPVAPPAETRPLLPSTQEARATSSNPLREVPVATWICAGVAAALLGVGLGFGVSAGNIDHRAGVNVAASGVDQGLTRRTALAGQTDANVANGFFIGTGVVALVGLAFAAFAPEPSSRWETATPAKAP